MGKRMGYGTGMEKARLGIFSGSTPYSPRRKRNSKRRKRVIRRRIETSKRRNEGYRGKTQGLGKKEKIK